MDLKILQPVILYLVHNLVNNYDTYMIASILFINIILLNKKPIEIKTIKKYYINQDTQTEKQIEIKKIAPNLYESSATKKDLGLSDSPSPIIPNLMPTKKAKSQDNSWNWWATKNYD